MPFAIVRNDITKMRVDAIVNAASRLPQVNPGVDLAIHRAAGPRLLESRKEIGCIAPGSAAITPAFDLDARFVIHAATPVWEDGAHRELHLLRQAYDMCLALAAENGCLSIAFPLLAAGNHGFPQREALQVALSAFSEFLLKQEMQIYLVVFGEESVRLSEKVVQNVASYIDQHYVERYEAAIYADSGPRHRAERYRARPNRGAPMAMPCGAAPKKAAPGDLDAFLKQKDAGFMETLLELIRKSGKKNADVYKRANISKQHFSKLVNDPKAAITKPVAVAFALALELDLQQTRELIGRAGYTLTNSSIFDLIVQYHIENKQYNVVEINVVLYEFDQVLLGSQAC